MHVLAHVHSLFMFVSGLAYRAPDDVDPLRHSALFESLAGLMSHGSTPAESPVPGYGALVEQTRAGAYMGACTRACVCACGVRVRYARGLYVCGRILCGYPVACYVVFTLRVR